MKQDLTQWSISSSYALHYKDPYVQQWNFTIERDLGFQTGLRVSYAGGWNPTNFAGEGGLETSDYHNPNYDYGHVPFTRNHRAIANFLYEISSHSNNRLVNQLVGGWEVAGRLMFQTGPYLSVLAPGTDPSGTNFANTAVGGDPRADIVAGAPIYPSTRSIKQWVNPAAFALPADNI